MNTKLVKWSFQIMFFQVLPFYFVKFYDKDLYYENWESMTQIIYRIYEWSFVFLKLNSVILLVIKWDICTAAEAYSEPSHTSKMELFAIIVKGFQPLNSFAKISIIDVWLGSQYTFALVAASLNGENVFQKRPNISCKLYSSIKFSYEAS